MNGAIDLILPRRAFLAGLSSLPILAITSAEAEAPELLALGRDLDRVEALFLEAKERKRAARSLCDQLCPTVPADLVLAPTDSRALHALAERETDVEGKAIWPDPLAREGATPLHRPPRHILSAAKLRAEMKFTDLRTRVGRDLKRRLALAEHHEAAVISAIEASGLRSAEAARYFAKADLEKVAFSIGDLSAGTLAGLRIKARALMACGQIGEAERYRAAHLFAMQLAEDVIRIGEGAAPTVNV